METFIVEHTGVVLLILTVLIGIVGFFMSNFIKKVLTIERDVVKRQESMEHEMYEMKTNYLERFEDIKDHQAREAIRTREAIAELAVKITAILAKVDSQESFCRYVQSQKRKESHEKI